MKEKDIEYNKDVEFYKISHIRLGLGRTTVAYPKSPEALFSMLDVWRKGWQGANISYEYHFWRAQYYDFGGIAISKVINDDIKCYKKMNVHGLIEDGSQRSFFPTGLAFYTYARTLYDGSLSAEDIAIALKQTEENARIRAERMVKCGLLAAEKKEREIFYSRGIN